jgi:hypothetical protein
MTTSLNEWWPFGNSSESTLGQAMVLLFQPGIRTTRRRLDAQSPRPAPGEALERSGHSRELAAVDRDGGTVDEGGGVGKQPGGELGDLVRRAEAPQRQR